MKAKITVLPGDGIGPEVTAAAVAVLRSRRRRATATSSTSTSSRSAASRSTCYGDPLPPATLASCRSADAVLLGAVGGPKWSDPNAKVRPEQGLLALRAALGVYANLRPVRVHPQLAALSPLKNEKLQGVDMLFLRELTGGAYFGAKTRTADTATDECRYTVAEIERVTRRAFELARKRQQARHLGRQGERARDVAPVAQHGDAHRGRLSRRDARTPARRFDGDAAADASPRLTT